MYHQITAVDVVDRSLMVYVGDLKSHETPPFLASIIVAELPKVAPDVTVQDVQDECNKRDLKMTVDRMRTIGKALLHMPTVNQKNVRQAHYDACPVHITVCDN